LVQVAVSNRLLSALFASFAVGIPDVFVAAALSRTPVGRVLQAIASGILGEPSCTRGSASILFGLVRQIATSFVIAVVYSIGSSSVTEIQRNPLIFGTRYGVVIFVVVPFSRACPKHRWEPKSFVAC
jgi:hypothetical protein